MIRGQAKAFLIQKPLRCFSRVKRPKKLPQSLTCVAAQNFRDCMSPAILSSSVIILSNSARSRQSTLPSEAITVSLFSVSSNSRTEPSRAIVASPSDAFSETEGTIFRPSPHTPQQYLYFIEEKTREGHKTRSGKFYGGYSWVSTALPI